MKKHIKIVSYILTFVIILSCTAIFVSAKTISNNTETADCKDNKIIYDLKTDNSEECYDDLKKLISDIKNSQAEKFLNLSDYECLKLILQNCDIKPGNTTPTECPPTQNPETPDDNVNTQPPTQEPTVAPEKPTEPAATEPTEDSTEPTQGKPDYTVPTQPTETTPSEPQAPNNYNEKYADEVIRLVNIEREKAGLSPLSRRDDVTEIAQIRAQEITEVFSHTRPNGTSCFSLANEKNISYKRVGENIAYGYNSPQTVVQGWMNSQGHRKNILSSSFNGIGVACYNKNGTLYWTQFFIGA